MILQLSNADPQNSATGMFLELWAQKVTEASGGGLTFNINHGGTLGGMRDTYDFVVNGATDIGWGLQSMYGNVFPMTEVFMLPMLGIQSARQGSYAIWDMYANTDFLKDEYSDTHVILVFTNCDSPISTKAKKIENYEALKGMSFRANGGPPTEFVQQMGGSPMSIVIGELYSAIEKGVVDAVITDWHAVWAFKLYEQFQYYLDAHCSVSPYFLVMNTDVYNSLPPLYKNAIDSYSGEEALKLATQWDDVQKEVMGIIANQGAEIYKFSDNDTAKLQDAAQRTRDAWIDGANAKGLPAQAAVDKALELIEKYK